jgi:hypothetical protein
LKRPLRPNRATTAEATAAKAIAAGREPFSDPAAADFSQ